MRSFFIDALMLTMHIMIVVYCSVFGVRLNSLALLIFIYGIFGNQPPVFYLAKRKRSMDLKHLIPGTGPIYHLNCSLTNWSFFGLYFSKQVLLKLKKNFFLN